MDVIVVGATGALGFEICRRLREKGRTVLAVHRSATPGAIAAVEGLGCQTMQLNIKDPPALAAIAATEADIIATPILTTSGPALRALSPKWRGRGVVFSSNNVQLEAPGDTYRGLIAEEAALAGLANPMSIIRPSMIYGYVGDGNISRLMAFARRWPIVPVPAYGAARCQPIHVDDLAALAVHALEADPMAGPVTAAGPAPLTMAQLVRMIVSAVGGARPVIPVPLTLLKLAATIGPIPLDPEQLARARQDRVPPRIPDIPGWQPRIEIETGLARLAAALDGGAPGPHMKSAS